MKTCPYKLFSNHDLIRLIIPLIIEQALFIAVGTVDSIMVASLGEASVSGVSVVDMINNFIFNIYSALSTGGAVIASQYLGAGKRELARDSAKQLLFVVLFCALLLMLYAECCNHFTLRLLFGSLEPDVMSQASIYFRITAGTYPIIAVYNACAALFRSQNKSSYPMWSSLLSNILNLFGNALLIFVFKMGVAGAAWATLFARFVSMLLLLYLLTNSSYDIFISFRTKFHISWKIIRKILFIGIPSSIENGIFQFGRLLVVGVIAKFGTSEIAANSVANHIDFMACIIGNGFSLAMITVIGQSVGAGIEAQMRYYVKKMMTWAYTGHVSVNIILLVLTPLFLKCYGNLSPDTLHLALVLILIHNGLGLILWPGSFCFPNVLRAANDVRFTMVTSISSMILIRLGLSYFIAWYWHIGALGVWTAMIIDWIVRITCFTLRYRSGAWLKGAGFTK